MNEPVVPLKEYLDTRFTDITKSYDVRISHVEKLVDSHGIRDAAAFQDTDKEMRMISDKITTVKESISEEISQVKLEIVGKEIFTAYIQRAADDFRELKEDVHRTHEAAAAVREGAAAALALAVVEQNKSISRLEKTPWGTYLTALGIFLGILGGLGTGFNYMVIQPMMRKDEVIEARIVTMEVAVQKLIDDWQASHTK